MSLYGTRRYHAFQAEEGDEDLGEDEEQEEEPIEEEGPLAGEGEGEEGIVPAATEPTPPTTVPETPAPPPAAPQFDFQGITNSLTGLVQSALGFFQTLDTGKFFILLGVFFLALGMFSKRSKISGISNTVIFMLGFLLILYGGISKYGSGAGLGGLLQQ